MVGSGSTAWPRVSAELPGTGERFEGLLPPAVAAPAFAIRKQAVAVFTLQDYVATGIMTVAAAEVLRHAVADRANILVAGGTSTGKTTLTNARLAEVAGTADRVVLIEDTREFQRLTPNLVALRTTDGLATLSDLVRSTLRLRPDGIPSGRCAEPRRSISCRPVPHGGSVHCPRAPPPRRSGGYRFRSRVAYAPRVVVPTNESGGRHDNYGVALTAQPGESERRPAANTRSQLIVCMGLPAPSCSLCRRPGRSQHTPSPEEPGQTSAPQRAYRLRRP